jgi:hypothetical protein
MPLPIRQFKHFIAAGPDNTPGLPPQKTHRSALLNQRLLFGCLFYRTSGLTASGPCRIIVPKVSLQRDIEGFRFGCGRTPLLFTFFRN